MISYSSKQVYAFKCVDAQDMSTPIEKIEYVLYCSSNEFLLKSTRYTIYEYAENTKSINLPSALGLG